MCRQCRRGGNWRRCSRGWQASALQRSGSGRTRQPRYLARRQARAGDAPCMQAFCMHTTACSMPPAGCMLFVNGRLTGQSTLFLAACAGYRPGAARGGSGRGRSWLPLGAAKPCQRLQPRGAHRHQRPARGATFHSENYHGYCDCKRIVGRMSGRRICVSNLHLRFTEASWLTQLCIVDQQPSTM